MSDKDELTKALEAAHPMTDEDREAQRKSFVYGNTKLEYPALTKEVVEDVAKKLAREGE